MGVHWTRRSRRLLVNLAVAALVLGGSAVAVGVVLTGNWPLRSEDAEAERRLTDAAERRNSFSLQGITDYRWERAVVIDAYASQEVVDEALGFHWGAGSALPRSQDDESLILFVRGQDVVGFIEDFAAASLGECMPESVKPGVHIAVRDVRDKSGSRYRLFAPSPTATGCVETFRRRVE
jgi:hypothetical protein